jgi:hypothetical protein
MNELADGLAAVGRLLSDVPTEPTGVMERAEQLAKAAEAMAEMGRRAVEIETKAEAATGASGRGDGRAGGGEARWKETEEALLKPARRMVERVKADAAGARGEMASLAAVAREQERKWRDAFAAYGRRLVESGDRQVAAAVARFDGMSRVGRAESMLLDGARPLLSELAARHHVELVSLRESEAERQWTNDDPAGLPQELELGANGLASDLTSGISQRMTAVRDGVRTPGTGTPAPGTADGSESGGPGDAGDVTATAAGGVGRTAVVLITDGQHNEGPSPTQMAQVLGNRRIPIYAVGMGSGEAPQDLAVLRVISPESVNRNDRLRGEVVLKDDMPAGRPFVMRIEHEGKVVWEKPLQTQGGAVRRIAFDVPMAELVAGKLTGLHRDVTVMALPMAMRVSVVPVEGEARTDNNEGAIHVRATTQKWRMLLLDGRARWETRYLRNVMERDERWSVNTVLAGVGAERQVVARGLGMGMFPAEKQELLAYDVVVLGELAAKLLKPEELEWLREFVEMRGGGLVLMDGQRGALREYASTAVGPLIPVTWRSESEPRATLHRLSLTESGRSRAALALEGDEEANAKLWEALAAPRWAAGVEVTAGAGETLVEAVWRDGDSKTDRSRTAVMVERRFGAGKVMYLGTDELWRWRLKVADRFHTKLWHQMVSRVMEEPYAVADQFVSLDAGAGRYQPGESAAIRLRLRDAEGRPVIHATAEAIIERSGVPVATVMLDADGNQGGVFRGKAGVLEAGQYTVRARVTGFAEGQIKAQTSFVVEAADRGEMAMLACSEPLLEQMARASGGEYLREERSGELSRMLEPLSTGRIVESETALWQSYWWFVPIMGLLSVEWFLRKRAGLM